MAAAPTFRSANVSYWQLGHASTFDIRATATPAPKMREVGNLPPGVAFTDQGSGTATLSGTPTQPGTYRLRIRANSGGHVTVQHLKMIVEEQATFTSPSFMTWPLGRSQSLTLSAKGYPAAALTESGSLPPGVTFEPYGRGTARLAGSPTQTGVYRFTLDADSAGTSAVQQSAVLVITQSPGITTPTSVDLPAGHADSFKVDAVGYPVPKLTIVGNLPAGMTFKDNGNGTGTLAGTPVEADAFSLEVVARSSVGVAQQYLMLDISATPTRTILTYHRIARTHKGVSLQMTATVDPGTSTPTGTVTFMMNPSVKLATVPLNPAGVASRTVQIPAGRHTLVANYNPKAGSGFASSSSKVIVYRAVALRSAPRGQELAASEKGFMGQSVVILEMLAAFAALVALAGGVAWWGLRRRRHMGW